VSTVFVCRRAAERKLAAWGLIPETSPERLAALKARFGREPSVNQLAGRGEPAA